MAAVHIYVAANSVRPVWQGDETFFLLAAGKLAGTGPTFMFNNSLLAYDSGWSIVLTPVWWLTTSSTGVYRGALIVTVACGVALIYPLYRIAREMEVGNRSAVLFAAVIAVLPARVFDSNYVITENFLTLVLVSLLAAAFHAYRTPTKPALVGFALLNALLLSTHQRSVGFVGVAIVWLLLWRGSRRRAGLIGGGVTIVACALAYLLNDRIIASIYQNTRGREDALGGALSGLRIPIYGEALLGQVFYQVVATLGLAMLGAVWLLTRFVKDARSREFGPWSFWFAAVSGTLLLLSLWLVPLIIASDRLDVVMYGRYLDPACVVLTLIGLVVCTRAFSRWSAVIQGALVLGVVWGFILVLVPRGASQRILIFPINDPGVLMYPWRVYTGADQDPWILVGVVVTAAVLARWVFARWRRLMALPIVVLCLTGVALTEVNVTNPFNAPWESACTFGPLVNQTGVTRAAAISSNDGVYAGAVLCLEQVTLVPVTPQSDLSGYAFVVAPNTWDRSEALGARRVAEDGYYDAALYVLPGAEQQRLIAAGLVQPASDGLLPPAAAKYSLVRAPGSTSPTSTSRTDPTTVDLRLTHTGIGAIWRIGTAWSSAGGVYLEETWTCPQGTSTSAVNLTRSMAPGDVLDIGAKLVPGPSARGDCTVRVDVRQVGSGDVALSGDPLTLSAVVR